MSGLLRLVERGDVLDSEEFECLRWAVPGILPEGLGVLAGSPKAGKSWFVLGVLLALAQGTDALGVAVGEPRPVLYLTLEDGKRRLQDRCRMLLGDDPIPANLHYVLRVRPDEVASLIREWQVHDGEEGSLVVVDTWGKARGGSGSAESAYDRDYRQAGALKAVADDFPGLPLLLVHHTRQQPSEDFVERVSGTNGLVGAADYVVLLDRQRQESEGILSVTGRDVMEAQYAVSLSDGGRWSLVGNSLAEAQTVANAVKASMGLGPSSTAVVAEVAKYPEGVSPKVIGDALGWSNDKAGKYLRRQASAGRIESVGRGLYGPVRGVRTSEEVDSLGHSDTSDTQREVSVCSACGGPAVPGWVASSGRMLCETHRDLELAR